jgi:pyrroline-5-carboxylate reductase
MRLKRRIALIGAGNMTEAIVAGLLKAEVLLPDLLYATDILSERHTHFKTRYGITISRDNREATAWGDIIILSVEPQILDAVLPQISPALQTGKLIISVAAGYPIARVSAQLGTEARIVRAMPNTPSTVLEGVTALAFGAGLSKEDREAARIIFESIGKVVVVEESMMDAVTGLSGSGPAYVYLILEALADGGVKVGLPRSVAELLAAQTALGAARMLLESGEHPGRLKDLVASPGGTTIEGIHQLEKGGLRAVLMSAVEEATTRSRELGASASQRSLAPSDPIQ